VSKDHVNTLYYGDNLDILRRYIKDESVDLIYLDPPFNSRASYNVLFEEKNGTAPVAQVRAFEDFWHWDMATESAYADIVTTGPAKLIDLLQALGAFLGQNDMMAYLVMMAARLAELHRVLKPTGSIYLHCDPTASHYIKLLMDAVFGPQFFRNEIAWKRTSGHSDAGRYGRAHDVILYYGRSDSVVWNQTYQPYDQQYVDQYYRYQDPDGRRFMSGDVTAAGLQGGGYEYEWKGIRRVWRVPQTTMERLDSENRLFYTRNGMPRIKRYLDESQGLPGQDVWTDIEALRSWHRERLGYPTQKPEALLSRIITASSNEGDIVMDPFCGCGTAVAVAERLRRRWIGIDITHLAITLMKNRLRDAFDSELSPFEVVGVPADVASARALAEQSKYEFEHWALGLVDARPAGEKKRGADAGIDGYIYFVDGESLGLRKVVVSVKGGTVGVAQVRDLRGVMEREQAPIGAFVTLEPPTQPMLREAAVAGFYESELLGRQYPRIQILTIEQLFAGHALQYPNPAQDAWRMRAADGTFKRAKRQYKSEGEQQALL
jgi:site-specific DNA-methyltransferase (adenine-specific)